MTVEATGGSGGSGPYQNTQAPKDVLPPRRTGAGLLATKSAFRIAPPPNNSISTQNRTEARRIVGEAQAETDPEAALKVLTAGCHGASPGLIRAVLADTRTQQIIVKLVDKWTARSPGETQSAAIQNIFDRFDALPDAALDLLVKRAVLKQLFASNRLSKVLALFLTPKGKIALDQFMRSKKFTTLPSETRFALISQVKNYPRKDVVIRNLELLAGKDWFRTCRFGDQQRFAKVISVLACYGFNEAQANTLAFILGPSGPRIEWAELDLGRGGEAEYRTESGPGTGSVVRLNRRALKANNVELLTEGDEAIDIALRVATHEINHILTKAIGDGTYRNLKAETVAFLVDFKVSKLGEASQQDAYSMISWICFDPREKGYDPIRATLRNENSPDHRPMVRLIAAMIGAKALGKDPEKATLKDLLAFDEKFQRDPNILSGTQPTIYPECVDGIPDNHDNHFAR